MNDGEKMVEILTFGGGAQHWRQVIESRVPGAVALQDLPDLLHDPGTQLSAQQLFLRLQHHRCRLLQVLAEHLPAARQQP